MKRSVIETVLGAVVLLLAICFLIFSYKTADVRRVSGYDVTAAFSGTGGLAEGDDVRISGVKVGSVNKLSLDPTKYLAIVTMSIDPSTKLPDDTAAIISSDGLLGGRYLELQPGASDKTMKNGDRIQYTQAPQNLEELLGKFIFSMGNKDDKSGGGTNSSTAAPGAMPSLSSATAGNTVPTNSVTIPPALPAPAAAAQDKKPASTPAASAPAASPAPGKATPVTPSSSGAMAPAAPLTPETHAAPAVESQTAPSDAAPTSLQPETPPTPPGLPGSESAMSDSAAQPQFQSATGTTTGAMTGGTTP